MTATTTLERREARLGLIKRVVAMLPLFSALGGLALFWRLCAGQNWAELGQACAAARWGILAVILSHALPIGLDALSWWVLFPDRRALNFRKMLGVRWVGEAVTNLLPATSLMGDIVRARWAAGPGVPLLVSCATVVVNITLGLVAQVVFTVIGMAVLAWTTGEGLDALTSSQAIVYSLLAAGAFYALQHHGLFRLLRKITMPVGGAAWLSDLLVKGERLDLAIQRIYADRTAIRRCFVVSVGYWLSGSMEIWLALYAFGFASWTKAVILEAAVQGVRSAAFFLPGAIGAQEGGYVLAGSFLGLPAEFSLLLSLIRRLRDLVWGMPGLIAWQVLEWRRRCANCAPAALVPVVSVAATPAAAVSAKEASLVG